VGAFCATNGVSTSMPRRQITSSLVDWVNSGLLLKRFMEFSVLFACDGFLRYLIRTVII
jgi:hypothetical protein